MSNIYLLIVCAICAAFCSFSLASVGKVWLEGMSRNPQSSSTMFVPGILVLGMIEIISMVLIAMIFLKS